MRGFFFLQNDALFLLRHITTYHHHIPYIYILYSMSYCIINPSGILSNFGFWLLLVLTHSILNAKYLYLDLTEELQILKGPALFPAAFFLQHFKSWSEKKIIDRLIRQCICPHHREDGENASIQQWAFWPMVRRLHILFGKSARSQQ